MTTGKTTALTRQTFVGRTKELEGKTGVLVGQDLPSVDEETEAGVQSPHWGNCLG